MLVVEAGPLREVADGLGDNLSKLSATVEQRLALRNERVVVAKQIHDDHEALAKALAPLVDDAGFDLTTGLQTAADGLEAAVMKTHLNDLADKQLVAFRTMLELAGEIAAGGWFVVNRADDDAFSAEPAQLWREVLRRQRLLERSGAQIRRRGRPAGEGVK